MKVLVSFKPNRNYDNFEGARMRKTIKGALELLNITHTDSLVDYYDVAHFISPEEENVLSDVLDNGAPVVVSALYSEDDPMASFTEGNTKEKFSTLTPKALRFLNKADIILVPSQGAVDFLKNNGVNKKIYPCYPGVNLARFDFSKEEEREIFHRYYRVDKNKKLVLAIGEYTHQMEGISSFINAAKKCPNAMFYYIGKYTFANRVSLRFKKFLKTTPPNVRFIDVPPDDVYRSALLNADVFMIPGYKIVGATSIAEAMAAKTQIIARKSAIFDGLLEDGETAHLAEFSETLASLTRDYLDGKIKPTIQQAYQKICDHPLKEFGEQLNKYYQLAMKEKVNRRL